MNELIKKEPQSIEEMKEQAEIMIASGLVPFDKVESVITVALMGKELGLGFATAINSIYDIKGKPALSVHLATALARKAGVDFQLIKDFEPVLDANKKIIDRVTTIKFFRFNKSLNKIIENDISYYWKDAVKAGYTTNHSWITKPKNMSRSRCLMEGIRFVASDALLGISYEASELLDNIKNSSYEIDNEGNVVNFTLKDAKGNTIK